MNGWIKSRLTSSVVSCGKNYEASYPWDILIMDNVYLRTEVRKGVTKGKWYTDIILKINTLKRLDLENTKKIQSKNYEINWESISSVLYFRHFLFTCHSKDTLLFYILLSFFYSHLLLWKKSRFASCNYICHACCLNYKA